MIPTPTNKTSKNLFKKSVSNTSNSINHKRLSEPVNKFFSSLKFNRQFFKSRIAVKISMDNKDQRRMETEVKYPNIKSPIEVNYILIRLSLHH